jgi:hypothetical protein
MPAAISVTRPVRALAAANLHRTPRAGICIDLKALPGTPSI